MLEAQLLKYGYLAYVILFVGTAFEGEASYLTAAYLAHRGHFDMTAIFVVAVVANVISTQFFYQLGRWKGYDALHAHVSPERAQKAIRWIGKQGTLLVLGSKFLFGFRVAIPAACGAAGMKPLRFSILNVAGALAWGILFGFTGFSIGHVLSWLVGKVNRHEEIIGFALFFAVVLLLAILHGRDVHGFKVLLEHPTELGEDSLDRVSDIAR